MTSARVSAYGLWLRFGGCARAAYHHKAHFKVPK